MLYPCAAGPECKLSFKYNNLSEIPSIDEIWNGPEMISIRRHVLDGKAEVLGCSECEHFGSGISLYDLFNYGDAASDVKKNANLNISEFLKGRLVLKSKPLYISADLSYTCNLKCALCELRFDKSKMASHQVSDLFTKYAAACRHMHISGGEPLMDRGFLNYLKNPLSNPPALSITTNGTYLSESLLRFLEHFKYVNLHISCDSFNKLMFEKMRTGSNFNRIIKNIQRAIKYKNKINNDFCGERWHVCLQIVPTIQNLVELPEYLDHANDMGVDSVASCLISGDFPDFDFIRYPSLLDKIDAVFLWNEINVRLKKYPHMEIYGLESILKTLELRASDQDRKAHE